MTTLTYSSIEECILDIIANTDAHYRVAVLASKFVFEDDWSYNNHPSDVRGVAISPNFDSEFPFIIFLQKGTLE